jgi:hypothetical protein
VPSAKPLDRRSFCTKIHDMSSVTLNIEQMTVEEKLAAMEALWQSLSRNEDDIPIPEWHLEILEERKREVEAGEAKIEDWDSVKAELRKLGR